MPVVVTAPARAMRRTICGPISRGSSEQPGNVETLDDGLDAGGPHAEIATIAAWTLLTGLLCYACLTCTEIWELKTVCQWCVTSSIIALLVFALESVLLKRQRLDAQAIGHRS